MRVLCPGLPEDWVGPDCTVAIHAVDLRSDGAPRKNAWHWSYSATHESPYEPPPPLTYDAFIETALVKVDADQEIPLSALERALRAPHEVLIADRGLVIAYEIAVNYFTPFHDGLPLITSQYRLALPAAATVDG